MTGCPLSSPHLRRDPLLPQRTPRVPQTLPYFRKDSQLVWNHTLFLLCPSAVDEGLVAPSTCLRLTNPMALPPHSMRQAQLNAFCPHVDWKDAVTPGCHFCSSVDLLSGNSITDHTHNTHTHTHVLKDHFAFALAYWTYLTTESTRRCRRRAP